MQRYCIGIHVLVLFIHFNALCFSIEPRSVVGASDDVSDDELESDSSSKQAEDISRYILPEINRILLLVVLEHVFVVKMLLSFIHFITQHHYCQSFRDFVDY